MKRAAQLSEHHETTTFSNVFYHETNERISESGMHEWPERTNRKISSSWERYTMQFGLISLIQPRPETSKSLRCRTACFASRGPLPPRYAPSWPGRRRSFRPWNTECCVPDIRSVSRDSRLSPVSHIPFHESFRLDTFNASTFVTNSFVCDIWPPSSIGTYTSVDLDPEEILNTKLKQTECTLTTLLKRAKIWLLYSAK